MSQEINILLMNKKAAEAHPTLPGLIEQIEASEAKKRLAAQARTQVKRLIEALLFANPEPVSFNKIREATDSLHPLRPSTLRDIIVDLREEYISSQRAFRLEEIAQGFILRTCPEFGPYIDILGRNKRSEKLSQASSEVLAIIAYRQPITRPQIEQIRGVDSSGVVQNLLDRELIAPVGRLEVAGRPTLYGTTQNFLTHYGLQSLSDLPKIN